MKQLVRGAWIAVIIGLVSFGLQFRPGPQGATDLFGRWWIDHVPSSRHEAMKAVFFSTHRVPGNMLLGWADNYETQFKWTTELFGYQASDTELKYRFPHDNSDWDSSYKVESIARTSDGMNLKLTIESNPRGPSVYYSTTRWDRRDVPSDLVEQLGLDS